jgi:hypothetical protein
MLLECWDDLACSGLECCCRASNVLVITARAMFCVIDALPRAFCQAVTATTAHVFVRQGGPHC